MRRRVQRRRRLAVLWWTAWLALLAVLGSVLYFLFRDGLQVAANMAQLISVALALLPLLWALVVWRRRTVRLPDPEELAKAVVYLADRVQRQWIEDARTWHTGVLPVCWKVTGRRKLMDHLGQVTDLDLDELAVDKGALDSLACNFPMLFQRRLILLGASGTGKTSLAVLLLLKLLENRSQNDPVPVFLTASRWEVAEDRSLREWLTDELCRLYPGLTDPEHGGPGTPEELVRSQRVIPFIDGLDDLPERVQRHFFSTLNNSLAMGDALVLTCHTKEYRDLVETTGKVIPGAVVLESMPIDPQHAREYLAISSDDVGDVVVDALIPADGDLSRTPDQVNAHMTRALDLWLFRTVYRDGDRDPSELLDPNVNRDPETLRAHMLAHVIPALIRNRPPSTHSHERFRPSRRYEPDQVRSWLGYLAHRCTNRTSHQEKQRRELLWWYVAATVNGPSRTIKLSVAVFTAIATTIITAGIVSGADLGVAGSIGFFGIALSYTWMVAASTDTHFARWRGEEPGIVAGLRSHVLAVMTILGFTGGVGVAGYTFILTMNAIFGSSERESADAATSSDIAVLLAVPLLFLAASALNQVLAVPTSGIDNLTSMTVWRSARRVTLIQVAVATAAGAAGTLAICARMDAPAFATVTVTIAGAGIIGLPAGLLPGRHHAWPAYVIAVDHLARTGRLPRNLIRFLDDAHRLGLLRAVGPAYQFRHAELEDHLAAHYQQQ